MSSVRWERLFEDLEAQLDAESARELDAEVADRTRRERALLGLQGRLVAACEARLTLELWVSGVGTVSGRVERVGADWLLVVTTDGSGETLVPFAAVRSLTGLAGAGGARDGAAIGLGSSLGLGSVLRAISRDRSTVEVVDTNGRVRSGTVDAVGADLLDLAEHPVDLPRRREHVLAVHTVPFAALAAVRRRT